MSYRDDFNSSMTNPGTYSPNSTYGAPGYSGNYGGTNNPGSQFTTIAQANLAAQNGGAFPSSGFPMTSQASSLLSKLYGNIPQTPTPTVAPNTMYPAPGGIADLAPPLSQLPPAQLPPGMTLAEYYAKINQLPPGTYMQRRTRPMAPNVYGQPPSTPPGGYGRTDYNTLGSILSRPNTTNVTQNGGVNKLQGQVPQGSGVPGQSGWGSYGGNI
jgi:hypothetical protein